RLVSPAPPYCQVLNTTQWVSTSDGVFCAKIAVAGRRRRSKLRFFENRPCARVFRSVCQRHCKRESRHDVNGCGAPRNALLKRCVATATLANVTRSLLALRSPLEVV